MPLGRTASRVRSGGPATPSPPHGARAPLRLHLRLSHQPARLPRVPSRGSGSYARKPAQPGAGAVRVIPGGIPACRIAICRRAARGHATIRPVRPVRHSRSAFHPLRTPFHPVATSELPQNGLLLSSTGEKRRGSGRAGVPSVLRHDASAPGVTRVYTRSARRSGPRPDRLARHRSSHRPAQARRPCIGLGLPDGGT
jgi:hypothetical protein